MRIPVIVYSTFGHTLKLAQAAAEGAAAEGAEVTLYRVAETLSDEILEKMGALEAQKSFADLPVAAPDALKNTDGLIMASSTRFGMMAAQMKQFLDATGQLWMAQDLADKPVAWLTSTSQQHGGQEVSAVSAYASLMHHGMIPVGLPYTFQGQMGEDEVKGGSPYAASTISGSTGSRMPSGPELDGARFQGQRLARIARKLSA